MILPAPELSSGGFRTRVIVPANSPIDVPILPGDRDWSGLVDLYPHTDAWPRHLLGGTLEFHPSYADLHLGFQDEVEPIRFVNLRFGATLLRDGAELASRVFPPKGVTYISTEPSQLWIDVIRFEYEPDHEYEIVIWAEERGERYESRWFFFAQSEPERPVGPVFATEPCARTININTADFCTLRTLRGVDEVRAQAIIDGRPWASIHDLSHITGINRRMVEGWDIET